LSSFFSLEYKFGGYLGSQKETLGFSNTTIFISFVSLPVRTHSRQFQDSFLFRGSDKRVKCSENCILNSTSRREAKRGIEIHSEPEGRDESRSHWGIKRNELAFSERADKNKPNLIPALLSSNEIGAAESHHATSEA